MPPAPPPCVMHTPIRISNVSVATEVGTTSIQSRIARGTETRVYRDRYLRCCCRSWISEFRPFGHSEWTRIRIPRNSCTRLSSLPLSFRCLSSFFRNFSPPPSFPILLFSSPGSTIVPPARAHGTLNIRFFETFGFPVSVERSGNARYRLYTCLSTFSLVPPSPSPFRMYEWDDTWTKCLRDN